MTSKSIQYYKWSVKLYKELFQSFRSKVNMKSIQFYMPIYSLYFHVHNTLKSNLKIDLRRNYYLRRIKEITKERYYNSNMLLIGSVYDSSKNRLEDKAMFCKCIPILDPVHCINNNYNLVTTNNHHLPSSYNFNTFKKINDMNNTAYIDVFFSFLCGQLTSSNKSPSFPLYYGSMNGLGKYKYDITEEYHDMKVDKCFNKTLDKGFTIDVYIDNEFENLSEHSDTDSIESISRSDMSDCSLRSSRSGGSLRSSMSSMSPMSSRSSRSSRSSDSYTNNDYIATIKDTPLQYLFIEQMEATLEDLIYDDISGDVLTSCLFQIAFALTYLQKHFRFTHNDLHINNVMYATTEKEYLYYKYNNLYYRVPTYGKIFKIIDFGRAIFTHNNKVFMNDVFSNYGEAGGQYSHPSQVDFKVTTDKSPVLPNYHFDLCRLSMTILEEIDSDKYPVELTGFLNQMCVDNSGKSFCELNDDFRLYISIAKEAHNSLPREIITNDIFKTYRVSKKIFPRKSFYTV